MLAAAGLIGFVPVTDLAEAEKFFCGKLGLTKMEVNGYALVLEAAGGAMVRCVLTNGTKPVPFTILGWEVADMAAAMGDLQKAGIAPIVYPHFDQDGAGVWTAPNGDQVAWFNDPDGNVLSLSSHKLPAGSAKK